MLKHRDFKEAKVNCRPSRKRSKSLSDGFENKKVSSFHCEIPYEL